MLNNKGYSVKEMIILCSVLAVIFGIFIFKTSTAYQETDRSEEIQASEQKNLLTIAKLYVDANKDAFKEPETYFFGKELIEKHYLLDTSQDLSNTKIKVTHKLDTDEYIVEIP